VRDAEKSTRRVDSWIRDALYDRIAEEAAARKWSVAQVIRETLEERFATPPPGLRRKRTRNGD